MGPEEGRATSQARGRVKGETEDHLYVFEFYSPNLGLGGLTFCQLKQTLKCCLFDAGCIWK